MNEVIPPAARFVEAAGKNLRCGLCPHHCEIGPGQRGICGVRYNKNGNGDIPFYGKITALADDPIEKKPLYHFRPGTRILSVGFAGCNLRCPFCQNWHISQNIDAPACYMEPAELIGRAKNNGQIAYTYSEPLVHIEYLLDCMREARKAKVANVLVTNGCVNPGAADEVLSLADAVNVDLKCFSRETYSKVLGGDLDAVCGFIKTACAKGVHVEVTTLVVPGLNDSRTELDACTGFIADAGTKDSDGKSTIPWHLSAYHPDWKWNAPATPPDFLRAEVERAKKRAAFVYAGNIMAR